MRKPVRSIPSSEFRKTYQHINERVIVVVHNHPIGIWEPYVSPLAQQGVDNPANMGSPQSEEEVRSQE